LGPALGGMVFRTLRVEEARGFIMTDILAPRRKDLARASVEAFVY
jgi:acetolactate synthase regulatory subunit